MKRTTFSIVSLLLIGALLTGFVAAGQTDLDSLRLRGSLIFEGATDDGYETTIAVTDATADRTITLPNSSGTVALNPAAGSIEFEGATADAHETTLAVTDPTGDRTLTLPDETAAVMVSSLVTNGTAITNSVTGASNALVWEGATADDYALSLVATDPTADRTITLPDASGSPVLSLGVPDAANGLFMSGDDLKYEGSAADAHESIIRFAANPTADQIAVIPNSTGYMVLSEGDLQAANSFWGATNALMFEGATANDYETSITPTDPTADVTLTLPNETGTVALTSQAVDMTLEPDATGGNAGAKNEFIGLPRIKLVGGGAGTNPGGQTIALVDDTPDGEWAPVDASVTEAADTTYYRHGTKSYKATFAADAAAADGFIDAALGANASWEDMESVGLLVYATATWDAGDLTLVLTDDGGARTFDIPALAAANAWTWLEVDITDLDAGTGDSISDVAVLLSTAGATALGEFSVYVDIAYVWDATDEEALGVAIQQDGVLSVIDAAGGTNLAELTDYLVHYESGNDFLVYITDQSANEIVALVAY